MIWDARRDCVAIVYKYKACAGTSVMMVTVTQLAVQFSFWVYFVHFIADHTSAMHVILPHGQHGIPLHEADGELAS